MRLVERPRCPRPGHAKGKVWLNGSYGVAGHKRPRWKCIPPNGDKPHRFTEELPRQISDQGYCPHCERDYAALEGPTSAKAYAFGVKEIAECLIALSRGASYRQAATALRTTANRHPATHRSRHGQLAGDLCAVFAEVVAAPHEPESWPDGTLLLDEKPFFVRDRGQPRATKAFTVLGAYGSMTAREERRDRVSGPWRLYRRWPGQQRSAR
jgi:hypothetical protein